MKKVFNKIKYCYLILRNNLMNLYYKHFDVKEGLNIDKRNYPEVIVSLTSYPKRFPYLYIGLKSIFNQKVKPDRVILYLDDTVNDEEITDDLRSLEKWGLEILKRPENIKPHKKYYYAMKENPNSIIINVDDDCIYNRNLVSNLLKSYELYPNYVSAIRVHEITYNSNHEINNYNQWNWESKISEPSYNLFATGVAGVLYPPHIFGEATFDLNIIKEFTLTQDDIWLKIMEYLYNIKVIRVKCKIHANVSGSQETALNSLNVHNGNNDIIMDRLLKKYNINAYSYLNGGKVESK